jgi:hypothetical protein
LKLQSVPLRLVCYLLSWLNRSLRNPELLVMRPVSYWRSCTTTQQQGTVVLDDAVCIRVTSWSTYSTASSAQLMTPHVCASPQTCSRISEE